MSFVRVLISTHFFSKKLCIFISVIYQFVHCQIETGAIFISSNGFGPSEVCLLKLEDVFVPCNIAYKFVRRAFDLVKEKSGVWTWIWCTGLCFSRFYSFLVLPRKKGQLHLI